ncbi:MAG TPA: hypothetical protein VMR37_07820 [Rhabdochlamydiaceae bacterium]|jgi:hypothetical protein|nr:hypothetical protein [Rhabdochlamydiaceae bacterium]
MSKQALKDYNQSKKRKTPTERKTVTTSTEKPEKVPVYKDKRNKRYGLDSSKFNLWPLISKESQSMVVYKSAIRLIQILYQDADFYKDTRDPELARKIVDEMISKKGESLSELFPTKELAGIYYKMLKGTNTGYPSLEEYFKIEKTDNTPPINWSYASTPILLAVLGEDTTNRVLAAEKASWEENHRQRILTEANLKVLLQNHANPDFSITDLNTIFSFNRKGKGSPHSYVEKQTKVMAIR